MRVLHLPASLTDDDTAALAGTFLGAESYDVVLSQEDADVYTTEGSLLLKVRTGCLPGALCRTAYAELRYDGLYGGESNRGLAGGRLDGVTKQQPVRKAGYRSNTNIAASGRVRSGIVGYFDRYPRIPYCRQTSFTQHRPAAFARCCPLFSAIAEVFQSEVPDRYAAQAAMIARTHPDFYIPGTIFTTVTVNKNWRTAVHVDAGDLKVGFGVLTAFRVGTYTGCLFVFPKYRVAVDLHTGDVLLCDVHQWHGNTPLVGVPGRFERVSLVLYYREHMVQCGSAAAELARAKRRRHGDPLYD